MNPELIKCLKPTGEGFNIEPFEKYRKRASLLLPNFPDCVLENWVHRHYSDINDYSFLGFENMVFTEVLWSKEEIFNNIKSYYPGMIDDLGYQIYERQDKTWLQKYMLRHMTWNVPIVVYQNNSHIEMGKPYHLLEGHLRLNYFRTIYRKEKQSLKNNHRIWLVKIPMIEE